MLHIIALSITRYCVSTRARETWWSLQSFGRKWQMFRNRQTIDRTAVIPRSWNRAEQGANYSPTISRARISIARMAMTVARYWTNFRILRCATPCTWFRLQRPYIRSGYFSDIDTLLLRRTVSVLGVKIAARFALVVVPSISKDDTVTYRGITVAHKPSTSTACNRGNCECTERINNR